MSCNMIWPKQIISFEEVLFFSVLFLYLNKYMNTLIMG